MSDLSKILREEYRKIQNTVNAQSLIEMIEEAMDELSRAMAQPIEEMSAPDTSRTYHISEIPMIPISELGWANADDDAASDDPNTPPSQRRALEQYLSNIPGTGFEDKLNAVSRIMEEGIDSIPKENPREFIQQAMAFLVFYKTLTMAITNFNASAAGFNFEAFLAALMDGKQIPASGAQTIADITANVDGERVPISLKLYTDAGLEVGGSFYDLSNDMLEPNPEWGGWITSHPEFEGGAMRYIACTKLLKGAGVEQQGSINFYEFDITRENLFRVLAATTKGRACIQSNRQFMTALTQYMETGEESEVLNWTQNIPARSDTSDSAEMSSLWSDYLDNTDLTPLLQAGLDEGQLDAVKDAVLRLYIQTIEATQSANLLAKPAGALKVAILSVINPEINPRSRHPDSKLAGVVKDAVLTIFGQFKKDVLRKRDARAQFLNTIDEWVTGEEVAAWYGTLTPELKAMAIKNTRGYLGHYHWVLPRGETIKLGGGTPFAVLEIGAGAVMKVLETARGELMDEVFGIFEQMTRMSQELNAFFANGLEEPKKAEAGARAGERAAEKARKTAGINE
tara:strand:- start:5840 stop:7546 length:1707 start_codon:yes stop_codon:yes gene_type:complete